MILSPSQIYSLAQQAGFSGQSATTMTAIVLAESGGDPNNVNTNYVSDPGGSYGLAQINAASHPDDFSTPGAIYDPLTNLQDAYAISGNGTNFSPWSTYTTSNPALSYQNYLPQAQAAAAAAGNGDGGLTITAPSNFNPGGTDGTGTAPFSSQGDGGSDTSSSGGDYGGGGDTSSGGSTIGSLGSLAGTIAGLATGGASNAAGASWWNTLFSDVSDWLSRFGLIVLAIVFLGIAAYFFVKREGAPQIVNKIKTSV